MAISIADFQHSTDVLGRRNIDPVFNHIMHSCGMSQDGDFFH